MAIQVSTKRLQIDKARSNLMVLIIVATVIVVFCLMSTKALLSQASYQRRVINARNASLKQLQANVTSANQLVTQYDQVFEGTNPTNIIGGANTDSTNAVPPNGDNGRIVLDALPSKYDYPALLTSVSYILSRNGVQSPAISGNDETATANNAAVADPEPIPMQLTVSGTATYNQVKSLVGDFENSIRPFDLTNLQLSGTETTMSFTFDITTYYQPAKSLGLTTQEIH